MKKSKFYAKRNAYKLTFLLHLEFTFSFGNYFYKSPLNEVTEYTIPRGVEKIGALAFYSQKNLIKVEIPDTVRIISSSFTSCTSLTEIKIPSNIEQIDDKCFANSSKLEKIIIHKPEGSISGAPWGCPIGLRAVEWVP